ncbi:alpha-amylase family protein [Martelella endophytica]|uniref:Beta-galactosidase trimerisation domain-containing protein n=1 Tax=Martelella endophytica TaxID=1486262 RepID=A0A0D5LM95_MAREN|nr:alpha-amylase family protein [Martelella endophytica]AJY44872.1 hypothetical protein TM49_02860 [Martelella endophytica]
MTEWWHQPQRIVQTNLRLIDASLDPDDVADRLSAMGATAMLFNIGGIFAWYPTELPLQAPNPFLDRDLVGAMIEAAHRRNIRVIGRYDLSKGTAVAYDAHPEWFCHDAGGRPFEYNGTYQACVNGGWYHEQGIGVLRETLGRYAIDGLFFNMFGYLTTDYSYRPYGLCHCENCRRAFRDFSGLALPEKEDRSYPAYRAYLQFQQKTSTALADEIYTAVKAIRPDVGVSNMGRKSDFFRGEVNRRIDRARPEWAYLSGEEARNFRSLGDGAVRYSSALTHFVDFPWRYSAENGPAQVLRLAQQLANGADPHYYFMGTPDQPDRKPLPAVKSIFDFHREHEALYAALETAARVALYNSRKSRPYDRRSGAAEEAFRGAYSALLNAGIAFDTILDNRAEEADFAETHARYDTIILAGASCMSDAEAAGLDAYVRGGGRIVIIGEAGIYDATGSDADPTRLSCQPFDRIIETRADMRGGYLRVDSGSIGGLDTDVVMLDGPYHVVEPKTEAKTMGRLLMPQRFGPPELCFPEDGGESDLPGVITAPFGAGEAVYLPWQADRLFRRYGLSEYQSLIADLATAAERPQAVRLERPGRLELTVQRHRKTGDLVIHIVNYSGQNDNCHDEAFPLLDTTIMISNARGNHARTLVTPSELVLPPADDRGQRRLTIPKIGAFEVVVIPEEW